MLEQALNEIIGQKMMKMEKKYEEERVKYEERLNSVDEKVNGFASGLLIEISKLKQDISEIKGGGAAEMLTLESKNEARGDLMIELLEAKGKNMLLQMEMKEKEKILREKVNEEKVKFEDEISRLKLKLEELEKKNLDELKAQMENIRVTEAVENKQITSFDLVNGNGNFTPDNNNSLLEKSAGGEWFKWRKYPVVACVGPWQDYQNQINVSLHLKFQYPEKFRATFHLLPNVHYVLRHRAYNDTSPTCRNVFYLFGTSSALNYNYKSVLENYSMKDLKYKSVEVYVEPYPMAQRVHSYDGTLSWTMDNFYKRRQVEREDRIEYQESPYFYTGPKGYRVQLHVYLDGVGKTKRNGVTAQISFLTGEFDEGLSHNFPHRTTVTLSSPNDPEYNVTKSVEKNIVREKCYLIDLGDNEEVLYSMENDNLIINVTIKSSII